MNTGKQFRTTQILSKTLIIFLFFSSCNSNNQTAPSDLEEKEEREQSIKNEVVRKISEEYNASLALDSSRYRFSYQLQDIVKDNERLVVSNFEVLDIIRRDSSYIVSVKKGLTSPIFMELECTREQLKKLDLKGSRKRFRFSDKYLIVNIQNVGKIKFKLDSYGDAYEEDVETYLELEVANSYLLAGKLLAIH